MFYTFSFNDDFFDDLNNNVSREEFIKIENFIIHNFCEKENVFYSGSSKIIDKNKGKNGNNSDLLDNFLNDFEIREFGPFTDKPNNIIDFGFCGEKKKIGLIKSLSCKEILVNLRNTQMEVKNKIQDFWSSNEFNSKQEKIKSLEKVFKKIFKMSSKVIFVDRYIPRHVINNDASLIRSYKNTFNFLYHNLLSSNSKVIFYGGIHQKDCLNRLRNIIKEKNLDKPLNPDLNINEQDMKDELKLRLKELFKTDSKDLEKKLEYMKKKLESVFLVKNHSAWKSLHERRIMCFLDDQELNMQQAIKDNVIFVFNVSEKEAGLNLIGSNRNTTNDRMITMCRPRETKDIIKKWLKNVENEGNFDQIKISA